MPPQVNSVQLPTGVRLEYAEQGDPGGVPLLLLHGATDSRRSWEPVLPHLPPSIRAIALTQRGHGDSERPRDAGYRIEALADDAAAAIDTLELGPAVVAGHSMGGWAAQRLAIEHPELVRAVLLEAAFGSTRKDPDLAGFCEEVAALPEIELEFVREFQLSTTERQLSPGMLDLVVSESMKLPAWLWRELFGGFLQVDLEDRLASIEAPTLLLWGDRDGFVPRADQDRLAASIPDARLTVYEGTGHAVHWEEPERFAADLAAFVAAQASRGATVAP